MKPNTDNINLAISNPKYKIYEIVSNIYFGFRSTVNVQTRRYPKPQNRPYQIQNKSQTDNDIARIEQKLKRTLYIKLKTMPNN